MEAATLPQTVPAANRSTWRREEKLKKATVKPVPTFAPSDESYLRSLKGILHVFQEERV